MSSKPVDLDAFLSEVIGEGQVIRLFGRDWRLASELPALLMLRLQAGDEAVINDDGQMALLRACFNPPEQVDEMVEAGMGWSALTVVTQVAVGVLSGRDAEDILADLKAAHEANRAGQGEAEGPTEAPTP